MEPELYYMIYNTKEQDYISSELKQ